MRTPANLLRSHTNPFLLALIGVVALAGTGMAQHRDVKEKAKGRNSGDYSFDLRLPAGRRISKIGFAGKYGFHVYHEEAVFRTGGAELLVDSVGKRSQIGANWSNYAFEIPKGDYIKKMTISWTGGLTLASPLGGIRVTTASGKTVTHGTMSPRPSPSRHYFEKEGYEIVGFHGKASSSGVYMFGVHWRPLDEITLGENGQSSPARVLPAGERVGAVTAHFYSQGTSLGGIVFEGRKPGGEAGTTLRWGVMSSVPMRFEIPVDDYLSQFTLLRDRTGRAVGVTLKTYRRTIKHFLREPVAISDDVNYPNGYEVVGLVGEPRGLDKDENIVRVLRVRRGQSEYYTGRSQCPGNNRLIRSLTSPTFGAPLGFAVTGTKTAVAFIGFARAEIPLPGACDLLVHNPLMMPMPIYKPLNTPALLLEIPNSAGLFMGRICGQALCIESGPTLGAGTMTRGIEFSIGAR